MPSTAARSRESKKQPTGSPYNLAVSYTLVSTQGQTTERQERALEEWMADHPEYELQDRRHDKQSGRNLNRLDWLLNGDYPHGTVSVVQDIDRFSCLGVTDDVDLLFELWRAGLTIAVVGAPFEGEVIKDLDKKGEEIIRELNRARREAIANGTSPMTRCGSTVS